MQPDATSNELFSACYLLKNFQVARDYDKEEFCKPFWTIIILCILCQKNIERLKILS